MLHLNLFTLPYSARAAYSSATIMPHSALRTRKPRRRTQSRTLFPSISRAWPCGKALFMDHTRARTPYEPYQAQYCYPKVSSCWTAICPRVVPSRPRKHHTHSQGAHNIHTWKNPLSRVQQPCGAKTLLVDPFPAGAIPNRAREGALFPDGARRRQGASAICVARLRRSRIRAQSS
ncbi:hypothetical protein K466DRAFT_271178 [Polyporus arcularius HHB13444]|uniref:Uncharacterized protein n=1 Tax=Polyporus arcularius HHB13444 TaxID=1314778 RepID=A0A5C3P0Q1_9APHY|nr:hypothetical protein K466DRAFT_271178 [Polyporus arcularius HHB13444]